MDIDELKRAAKAARTAWIELEGRKFSVTAPTAHELRIEYLRAGGGAWKEGEPVDRAAYAVCERALLTKAICDWQNVTQKDLIDTGNDEFIPFDAGAVPVLLDIHPEWELKLSEAMTAKMSERKTETELARKN